MDDLRQNNTENRGSILLYTKNMLSINMRDKSTKWKSSTILFGNYDQFKY